MGNKIHRNIILGLLLALLMQMMPESLLLAVHGHDHTVDINCCLDYHFEEQHEHCMVLSVFDLPIGFEFQKFQFLDFRVSAYYLSLSISIIEPSAFFWKTSRGPPKSVIS